MTSNGNEPTQPQPTITIRFTPDGQMELHAEGVGPPQLWAASRMLETWGDSEFASQMIAAQEHGKGRAIMTPSGIRRIGQ